MLKKIVYNEEYVANIAINIRSLTDKLEKIKASPIASEIGDELQKIEAKLDTIKAIHKLMNRGLEIKKSRGELL